MILTTFLICILRFRSKIKKEKSWLDSPAPSAVIIFLLTFIMASYLDSESLMKTSWLNAALYMIVYFLHINLTHIYSFLQENQETANLPSRQIQKTNKILIITFLLLTLCAMIIMPFTKIDKIILSIGHFALALIKYLLHIIPFSDSVYEAPTQDTTELMLQPELAVAQATPEWLTFLFDMLFFLLSIVIFIGVVVGLSYILYRLYKRFYPSIEENGDQKEFLPLSTNFSKSQKQKRRKKHNLWVDYTPNGLIRKNYKRLIKKKLTTPPPPSLSPNEIEEIALIKNTENIETIHNLYEKARYSQLGCTYEESALMKKLIQNKEK